MSQFVELLDIQEHYWKLLFLYLPKLLIHLYLYLANMLKLTQLLGPRRSWERWTTPPWSGSRSRPCLLCQNISAPKFETFPQPQMKSFQNEGWTISLQVVFWSPCQEWHKSFLCARSSFWLIDPGSSVVALVFTSSNIHLFWAGQSASFLVKSCLSTGTGTGTSTSTGTGPPAPSWCEPHQPTSRAGPHPTPSLQLLLLQGNQHCRTWDKFWQPRSRGPDGP